jgi:hypothetical protein
MIDWLGWLAIDPSWTPARPEWWRAGLALALVLALWFSIIARDLGGLLWKKWTTRRTTVPFARRASGAASRTRGTA